MRALILPVMLVALSSVLTGCALPDLVAHAVKEVEKSQRDGGGKPSTAERPPVAASQDSREEEAPPPVAAPQPRRSSVTVEELPAR